MTYLQAVNRVLELLREGSVASVANNEYSALIGRFVNDAMREVEDANPIGWTSLRNVIELTLTDGDNTFIVADFNQRTTLMRDINNDPVVYHDDENLTPIMYVSSAAMEKLTRSTHTPNQPLYFSITGEVAGDRVLKFHPDPDDDYDILIHVIQPSAELSDDEDDILVPAHVVVLGAWYKAIVERGEDLGKTSAEAYGDYQLALSNAIIADTGLHSNELTARVR